MTEETNQSTGQTRAHNKPPWALSQGEEGNFNTYIAQWYEPNRPLMLAIGRAVYRYVSAGRITIDNYFYSTVIEELTDVLANQEVVYSGLDERGWKVQIESEYLRKCRELAKVITGVLATH